jgi:hypothetical protein
MTIRGLYNKIAALDTNAIAIESITESVDEIRRYNLQQMLDGKTNKGLDITPSYFNDPFFKTPEAARAYSAWKDKISPPSNRKPGTPNYYINGYFHSTVKVEVVGEVLKIGSAATIGKLIEAKQPDLMGLSPENKKLLIEHVILPRFKMKIERLTGLKFS